MSPERPRLARRLRPTTPLLVAAVVALVFVARGPPFLLATGAVLGLALTVGLSLSGRPALRALAIVPTLAGAVGLVAASAAGPLPELLAGLAGVALLAWLADAPDRPPRPALRGWYVWGIPGLAVAVAWTGAIFLPSPPAELGVAGALLAAALVAIAYLARRPEPLDRPVAPTL